MSYHQHSSSSSSACPCPPDDWRSETPHTRGSSRASTAPAVVPGTGGGGGGDTSFLALLTAKCYADQTGGPSGTAATNCLVDVNCDGNGDPYRYIAYSWVRVEEDAAYPGPPCPLTYSATGEVGGPPNCMPAYHIHNHDWPVWMPGASKPACDDVGGDSVTGSVAPHSVVRLRPGAGGDYYIFGDEVWIDLFRRTGESDADGEKAYVRSYDQNTGGWRDGAEVRLVEAE